MMRIPGLYFVIACGHSARFVRPDPENYLHTVGRVDLRTVQRNDSDASGPRGPPATEPRRFVPLLARRIGDDLAVDVFTHLVLVAPPDVLQELTALLDAPTTASLVGSLAQDLMGVPDLELWPHLLPWIRSRKVDCMPGVPSEE